MDALSQVQRWPVGSAAVVVLRRDAEGVVRRVAAVGDTGRAFQLASVSKLMSAYAALIAVEEGAFSLADPAGPETSTVAHLLAHASGLEFSGTRVLARPGTRRIYSNTGFEELGRVLEGATGIAFDAYLAEAVFTPLGMSGTVLRGSPAFGVTATAADVAAFAGELLSPSLLSAQTHAAAASVAFPGLSGVLPGFGAQDPNDWGLGFEIRGHKNPHWTGKANSPSTFGHFGRAGTFLWVDPSVGIACVGLADRDFGDWSVKAWPALSDDVLAELGVGAAT